MTLATTCPACNGKGTVVTKPCDNCEGTGRAPFKRSVTAVVPPGVDTGMRLRLAKEGEHPEIGGEPGDLYVFIEVEPSERFEREGNDLYCEVTVPFTQAILGHRLEIEVVDETVEVMLPPGTQPEDEIRIRGKGAPHVGGDGAGDLVVRVRVALPKQLTGQEKKLIKELDALFGRDR
jgi:molecular chaperone DnaJ